MLIITPDNKNNLSTEEKQELMESFNKVIVQCWQDDSFKAMLTEKPVEVLKTYNINLEAFENVSVIQIDESTETIQSSKNDFIVQIPPMPDIAELDEIDISEEELESAAGGATPAAYIAVASTIAGVVASVDAASKWWRGNDDEDDDQASAAGSGFDSYAGGPDEGGGGYPGSGMA